MKTANQSRPFMIVATINHRWALFSLTYCAVYNLTQRRFVAPFENLALLWLTIGGTRRRVDGGIQDGAAIQARIFTVDP
jgi:hypothetical protein